MTDGFATAKNRM